MIELKPCPFCGCQPKIRKNIRFPKWKQGAIEAWEAVCLNYECMIYNANEQWFDSAESAAKAWNKRSNGWISCEDSLPKSETMVLVAIFGSDIVICEEGETVFDAIKRQKKNAKGRVTIGFIGEDGWYNTDGFPMICTPSYWMPLPEPPEVNEND